MKNMQGKRCLSFLITLALMLSLLPTGLFTTQALALSYDGYDSDVSNFKYTIYGLKTEDLADDGLVVESYTGSATAVKIPDEVSVTALVTLGKLTSAQQTAYTEAGITALPVTAVTRFLYSSKNGDSIQKICVGKNVTTLNERAFAGSSTDGTDLREIDFVSGSKLKIIHGYAFANQSLERVGVDGTDQMPSGLTLVAGYSFYQTYNLRSIDLSAATQLTDIMECAFADSGISSVQLPDSLTGISDSAFSDCRNLTSISFPAGITYFGPRVLKNCTSMTEVILKFKVYSGVTVYNDALTGLNRDCTIWVPQPDTQENYTETIRRIYESMCASGAVELRWLDSSGNKSGISPKPTPTASSGIVTLTGADAGNYSFTYDPTDADGDGLGGILYLEGSSAEVQLQINIGSAGNYTTTKWTWGQAYVDNRRGIRDYDALRGTELTEDMRRTETLNKAYNYKSGVTVSLKSTSNPQGLYYYFPRLINENTSYAKTTGSNGRPQSAADLPPVLVVYKPAVAHVTVQGAPSSTTSNLRLDQCAETGDYSCSLTKGSRLVIRGIDAWLDDYNAPLVSGVTPAAGSSRALKYTWYRSDDGTTTGGTVVASGTAVYDSYERTTGSGIYWRCPGPSESYIASLSPGTYQYYLVVTAEDSANETTQVVFTSSTLYTLNLYNTVNITGFTFDAADAADPANDFKTGSDGYDFTMRKGARNVVIRPTITGINGLDCTVEYKWSGAADGKIRKTSYFLSDWLRQDSGSASAYCYVYVYNSTGAQIASASTSFKVKFERVGGVYTPAATYTYEPTFDTEAQSQPQYVGKNKSKDTIYAYMTANARGEATTNASVLSLDGATYGLYLAPSASDNRGGTLIGSSTQITSLGEYTADGNGGYQGTFYFQFAAYEFPDYGVHYCYIKATNPDGSVAYSPVFPVIPTNNVASTATRPAERSVTVTSMPYSNLYVAEGDTASLTVGLELKNIPLTGSVTAYNSRGYATNVMQWQPYTSSSFGSIGSYNDVSAEYIVDELEVKGNEYTIRGRAILTVNNDTSLSGRLLASSTYADTDGGITVRLNIDKEKFASTSDTSDPDPTLLSFKLYSAAAGAVPTIFRQKRADTSSGGKEYVGWGKNENDVYGYIFKDGSELIPEDEFWLYSDRYDGKSADNNYNSPGSTENLVLFAEMAQVYKGSGMIVWQIENSAYPDDPAYNTQISERDAYIIYDSGPASDTTDSPKWSAFEDKLTVTQTAWQENYNYGESTHRSSWLTIDIPHGTKAMTLKITPLAVQTDSNGDWQAVSPGETYTIRINPVESATEPTVYLRSSNSLYLNPTGSVGTVLSGYATTPDNGTLTLQWYRSTDSYTDPAGDTPVGNTFTGTGTVDATHTLTAEELSTLGNTTVYYYLYAENYNRAAINNQRDSGTSRAITVAISSGYKFLQSSDVLSSYTGGTQTLSVGQEPQGDPFTLVMAAPTENKSQYVSYEVTYYKAGTTKELESSTGQMPTIVCDGSGNLSQTSAGSGTGFTATISDDGKQVTYSVPYDRLLGGTRGYSDSRTADYDMEFHWVITEYYSGDTGYYATGGNKATAETTPFTVQQRRESKPTITSIAVDSAAQVEAIPKESYPAGLVTALDAIPAFQQATSDINYMRPITYTPVITGDTENRTLNVKLQYFDTGIDAETGEAIGWKDILYGFGAAYFPSDSGGYTSAFYDGYNKAVSGQPTTVCLMDNGVAFNKDDSVLFLRLAVRTRYGEAEDSASDPCYSDPVALVRHTGIAVNAGTPQYSGSASAYPGNYYWNSGAGGEESHTFGADEACWSVTESEGVPTGELTFQWEWWNRSAGTWVAIAGAADAAFTVDKTTLQSWVDNNGEDTISIRLRAINTNNSPLITGNRTGEHDIYTDIHFVQAANVPAGLTITGTPGDPITAYSTGTNLTVNAANTSNLKSLSYKWEIRVTEATPPGGAPVSSPFDSSYPHQWDTLGTTQTLAVPTMGSGVMVRVPQAGGNLQTWNMEDLWKSYDAIKVELRCTVTNTDSGIADPSAQTATATVGGAELTIQIPQTVKDQHITASGTTITDDTAITLTAPEIAGVSYQWCRSNPEGDIVMTVSGATERTLTVTADDYDSRNPKYLCKLTDSATGISRYTDSIQLGISLSGSAAAPIVTVKKDVYVCDPNGLDAASRFDLDAEVADGGALTYQWEQKVNGKWTVLAGETHDYLDLADRDDEVGYHEYRCTVTNTKGVYTATATSNYRLTVRGIVLTRDDSLNPVAGQSFATGFTLRAYGLSGNNLTWSIPDTVTAYTLGKSTTYVSGSDGSTPIANTLTADAAETAKFDLTVTTGAIEVYNRYGTGVLEKATGTYTVVLPVDLTAEPFGIATRKFTAQLDQTYTDASPLAALAIDGGSYTAQSWVWSGDVPEGLTLSADGKITGTPTVPGRYAVDVTVTATDSTAVTNMVTVIVPSPAAGTEHSLYLTVDGTEYSSAPTADYSGPGWDWSYEAGVLTLDGYSGDRIRLFSYDSTGGAYIRVKGASTVTASGSGNTALSSDGPGTLYLYGGKDLTVTSGYYGIYARDGLDLSQYKGALTVTAQGDGTGNVAGISGDVTGAGAQGSLTVTAKNGDAVDGVSGNLSCSGSHAVTINAEGSVQSVFGVDGALTAEGTGTVAVHVTASGTAQPIYGVYSNVTANQSESGKLTITVNSSAAPGTGDYYAWGVHSRLTQSGTGAVQVNVTQTSPGTIRYVAGVLHLTVENGGTVVVKADGGGTASSAGAIWNTVTTTGDIGSVSLKGVNAEHATGAGSIPNLKHTNGSITFEGDTYGLAQGPADASWFMVNGSPGSASVQYIAGVSKTPKFTVDGVAQDGDYALNLQNGQAMTPITIAAYANGGCTVALTSDLPAGLSWNSSTGVLSGTPTVSGSGKITFTATNNSSGDSKAFTVNWSSNNLLLKYGGWNTRYYNTGNVQVNRGDTTYPIRLYSVGDRPTNWSITVDGVPWSGGLNDDGGGAALKPAAGTGDSYTASGYWTFKYDASKNAVGDIVEITATPLDSNKDAMAAPLKFDLQIVPANTPQQLVIGAAYVYDPGVNDGSGTGWSWSKSALTLTLDGYGGAGIYVNDSQNCDLTISLTGDNTITTSGYNTGLSARNVTLEGSGSLNLDCEASTVRGIRADSVTVEGGSLSVIMEAGNDMWLSATGAERTLNIGPGANSVLLQCGEDYKGTANAAVTVNKPSGVAHYEYKNDLLYAYGTALPTPVVTIDGLDTVTVGEAVDLVANIQPWMAGMTVYNASGTEVEGTYTYVWADKDDGGFAYDQQTLNRPAGEIGTPGASGRYLCTVTYANAALGSGTTSGTSEIHTLTVVAAGVTVSGRVKSYNPGNAITIQLKQGAEVKYTTTIAAESGSGQVTQDFSFSTVAAGTYDLVITKGGHLTYTVTGVVVGSSDLDLTTNSKDYISTMTLLAGDVNMDGKITESDVSAIRYSSNINKETSTAATPLADVNGDGRVTESDVSVVRYAQHINKSEANCTYTYAE